MGTLYGLDYFDQVQYRVVHKGQERTLVISALAMINRSRKQALPFSIVPTLHGQAGSQKCTTRYCT